MAGIGRRGVLAALGGLAAGSRGAMAAASPAGLWRTFDDRTGRERGLVRIVAAGGVLTGTIAGTVDPAEGAHACEACPGALRGQPILGLTILTGLQPDGDEWSGGRILDPESGAVYRCRARLAEGGQVLVLRGYIGIALIGRSQSWRRLE